MPKKILLADDSITIQKVVELTFSDGDYEVVATNNGTKAIEALSTLRPDIILSDIIMPEKNGYEVCEYVKSHPELKHIPVVLLTGTFEPFDPDRAEKAGCDAVVTKPFESQGLIQKVEQLIQGAGAHAAPTVEAAHSVPAPAPVAPPAPIDDGPFMDDLPATAAPPPDDIFGDAAPPLAEPQDSGETKLIPKMTFEDLQRMEAEQDAPAPPEESPFAASEATEPAPAMEMEEDTGETKLIPKMTFEDLQALRNEPPPPPPAEEPEPFAAAESPFEDTPVADEQEAAPSFSMEPPPEPPAFSMEPSEPEAPEFPMEPPPEPEPVAEPEDTGETKLIPKMTFEQIQQMQQPEPEPVVDEPAVSPFEEEAPVEVEAVVASPFQSEEQEAAAFEAPAPSEATPFEEPAEEMPPPVAAEPDFGFEPSVEETEVPEEPVAAFEEPEPVPEAPAAVSAVSAGPLGQDDIDRIARRVVEMMSDNAIKDVAWEVIPEVAEMAVRERIRELEAEED